MFMSTLPKKCGVSAILAHYLRFVPSDVYKHKLEEVLFVLFGLRRDKFTKKNTKTLMTQVMLVVRGLLYFHGSKQHPDSLLKTPLFVDAIPRIAEDTEFTGLIDELVNQLFPRKIQEEIYTGLNRPIGGGPFNSKVHAMHQLSLIHI